LFICSFQISCSARDKLLYILILLKRELVQKKVIIFVNSIDMGYRLRIFLEKVCSHQKTPSLYNKLDLILNIPFSSIICKKLFMILNCQNINLDMLHSDLSIRPSQSQSSVSIAATCFSSQWLKVETYCWILTSRDYILINVF